MDVETNRVQAEWPSSPIKAGLWASLPVEVRQMILRLVALPIPERRSNSVVSLKVARFATVCFEWQVFFETCTFRRLVLDPDSLGEFDAVVKRQDARLGYVRKLWLRIRLPKYECPDCDEPEDKATQHRNNAVFKTCIQSLLETLKLWDPARHGAEGLALMLSASSPSDTEHRFNRCEIEDSYPFHYAEDLDLAPEMVDSYRANIFDPFSGYFHRRLPPPFGNGHVKRVLGTPLRFEPRRDERGRFVSECQSLPAVPMIKGLIMRRQFSRNIHLRTLSWLLSRSFVALEWFRFERTVSLEPCKQVSFDKVFQLHLLPSLPKTLRQFSFTQWEPPKIERDTGLDTDLEEVGSGVPPHTQDYLPRGMAKLSQRLEQLCPPWQMDAATFLRSIIELGESSEMLESHLKRIILRCSIPNSDKSRRDFGSLVILAAKAALSLPKLEVIELWGSCLDKQDSRAYIFRYSYKDDRAGIVWRSCEKTMAARAQIIGKWSEVAQKRSPYSTLAYTVAPFAETQEDIFKSDGTCIYRHLLLKILAFDPITQLILENEPCGWGLEEESDSSEQDDPPSPTFANPNSMGDPPLVDIIGLDSDLESLQAAVMAFEPEADVFLQQHYG